MSVNNITFYQILKTIKKGQVMGFQETNFIPFKFKLACNIPGQL